MARLARVAAARGEESECAGGAPEAAHVAQEPFTVNVKCPSVGCVSTDTTDQWTV